MITLSHLTKTFGEFVAVDDLSLEINQGEILGFLGPNGAGKTTTIRMICGLLQHDGGEIRWETKAPLSEVMGVCPQENLFWPKLTCLEQLVFLGQMHKLSVEKSKHRALDLLEVLGLSTKQNILAAKLSGGMKRRLNIALALIHDPSVLILDEPEAGLDPQSRILVRDLIRSLAQEKTVILTTHNMDEAERLADRVAIIDQGKLLRIGSVESLKQTLGSGDFLEIRFTFPPTESQHSQLKDALVTRESLTSEQLQFVQDKVVIRSLNALEKLSRITEIIQSFDLEIQDVQLRKTTLEDVFINLTGRALRE